jgi:sec-independent protein translocase protein TatB
VFNIGPQELLLILLIALVVVGPQRLPELARTIGRALNELRRAQDEVNRTIRLGLDEAEPVRPATPKARTRPSAAEPAAEGEGPAGEAAATGREAASAEGSVADVARTLGRGLAEIRRARREVQRTFRIDLTDEPSGRSEPVSGAPTRPAGPVPPAPGSAAAPAPEQARSEQTSPAATPEDPERAG